MNRTKSVFLLTCVALLLVPEGNLGGGGQCEQFVAFLIAAGMNLFTSWDSVKIVFKRQKGQGGDESSHPDSYGRARLRAFRANLPMHRVYIIPSVATFLQPGATLRMLA